MSTEYLLISKSEEALSSVDLRFFGAATVGVQKSNDAEGKFNRYCLTYKAGCPIRAKLYYKNSAGDSVFEEFYLEASLEEAVFRSFTDEYLDGKYACAAEKIEFYNTKSVPCRVVISSFTTECAEILSSDTVYIENDFMKIGARLSWGGGLSCVYSKTQSPDGIENLLNNYDTGRLVQQSYLGAVDDPYHCSSYNTSPRTYTPNQGGDQHNNRSKLVDYRVGSNSMYVKCRPLDWFKNNVNTMSYMENTYSLSGKLLRVDNRFMDFSPYEHTLLAHQELPAVYTISALKKFVFYNGDAPWTNDALTYKPELTFWGGNPDAYFRIKPNNTETWCAFTDDSEEGEDFGLGVFVPDISMIVAGRHKYDGSADPMSPSTNYFSPLRSMTLKSFKPIEYSYLVTAGPLAEMRETFRENATLIDNTELTKY